MLFPLILFLILIFCFRAVVKRQSVGGQRVVELGPDAMSLGLECDLGRRAVNDAVKGLARGRGIRGPELFDPASYEALRVLLPFVFAELVPDLGNRDAGSGLEVSQVTKTISTFRSSTASMGW